MVVIDNKLMEWLFSLMFTVFCSFLVCSFFFFLFMISLFIGDSIKKIMKELAILESRDNGKPVLLASMVDM